MRIFIIVLVVLFTSSPIFAYESYFGNTNETNQPSYSDAYQEGYQSGATYGKPFAIKPIAPITPIQKIGQSSPQDGYNRGFLDGLSKKRRY